MVVTINIAIYLPLLAACLQLPASVLAFSSSSSRFTSVHLKHANLSSSSRISIAACPLSPAIAKFQNKKALYCGRRSSSQHSNSNRASTTYLKSTIAATNNESENNHNNNPFLARRERFFFEIQTLFRVLLPATISGLLAFLSLPTITYYVSNFVTRSIHPNQIGMLNDAVTSFISLIGLLYSILVGQVFGFLYSQQEVRVV